MFIKKIAWAWSRQLLPLLALSMLTCTREYIEGSREICFESEVLPIFQSHCTQSGCHNSQEQTEGYDMSSYDRIVSRGIEPGNYRGSKVYEALVSSGEERMPQAPYDRLTDDQITTIALWIEAGANNTTCEDTTACNTAGVTFSSAVRPILQTFCNGCHGGGSPQGNINFNTYNGVKATVNNGKLMGSIRHDPGFISMPENAAKLSACNISLIQAWVDAGAPNN